METLDILQAVEASVVQDGHMMKRTQTYLKLVISLEQKPEERYDSSLKCV